MVSLQVSFGPEKKKKQMSRGREMFICLALLFLLLRLGYRDNWKWLPPKKETQEVIDHNLLALSNNISDK